MLRSKKALAVSVILFFAVETVLGILFQTGHGNGAHLRYATVVLACLFCALLAEKSWDYLLTQLALVMTVCADWFLVLPSSPKQLSGMLFFSVAQLSYAALLYLAEGDPARRRWHIPTRVVLSVVALTATALVLQESCDAVALVSLFYYANLAVNLLFAWVSFRKHPLLAVGLLLFACCDTLIGLAFLDGYLPISETSIIYRIIHPGFDMAWAFYLPSQMLLAVSLLPKRWKDSLPLPIGSTTERKLS